MAELRLPIGAEQLLRYFEGVDREYPGEHWRNGAEMCRQWENTFNSAVAAKTRRVLLRIGFVLGRSGGALPVLARLARWFLGGTVGSLR